MKIHESVLTADGVRISGENISIGKESSIWYNAVIRCGKTQSVTIGERTNIQDLCMIHAGENHPVKVGDGVTVGHKCLLHGCTIGDHSLIGMGSIIMNGAVIGRDCIIGAGSLITEGKTIPDGHMAFGSPAKVIRKLSEEEIAKLSWTAKHYVEESRAVL